MRKLIFLVVLTAWTPSALAGGSPWQGGYLKPLDDDDTAIRQAISDCLAYVSDLQARNPRIKLPRYEFNACVAKRGIPLVFLLK
jgi:hypothetical protein